MNRTVTKLTQKIVCLLMSTAIVFGMLFSTSFAAGPDLEPTQKFILEVIELDDDARADFVDILENITPSNYLDYVDDVSAIISLNDDDITAALKAYANYPSTYKTAFLVMVENFRLSEIEAKDYTLFGFRRIQKMINFEVTGDYYDDRGIRLFVSVFKNLKYLTGKNSFFDDPSDPYKLDIKVGSNTLEKALNQLIGHIQSLKNRNIDTFDEFIAYIERVINSHANIEIYNFKRFLVSEGLGYSGALKKPSAAEEGVTLSPIERLYIELIAMSKAERDLFIFEVLDKIKDGNIAGVRQKAEELLGSMPREDLYAALEAFAAYADDNKATIKLALKFIGTGIEDEGFDTSKFSDIAERINFTFTGDYNDNKGFIIFVKILGTLRGLSTDDFIFDDKADPYKIDINVSKLKIYSIAKPYLDTIIKSMNSIRARGINSFDDYIAEFEAMVNAHPNEDIYYFKKFLYDGRWGYIGTLPNPKAVKPTPTAKPTSTTTPDENGGGGGGSTGGSTGGGTSTSTPVPTPAPTGTAIATEPAPTNVPAANPFIDLPDEHWAKENILNLVEKNVLTGYPDNTVKPDLEITRAEMAVIIARAIGLAPVENPNLKFKDSDAIGEWAAGYIQAAVENNIIVGYEDNTFRPANKLTREELVVMAMKAYKYEPADASSLEFADKADMGDWSIGYVAKAVETKIVVGYPDNTFKPKKNVTRAEAFTVIINCINSLADEAAE